MKLAAYTKFKRHIKIIGLINLFNPKLKYTLKREKRG